MIWSFLPESKTGSLVHRMFSIMDNLVSSLSIHPVSLDHPSSEAVEFAEAGKNWTSGSTQCSSGVGTLNRNILSVQCPEYNGRIALQHRIYAKLRVQPLSGCAKNKQVHPDSCPSPRYFFESTLGDHGLECLQKRLLFLSTKCLQKRLLFLSTNDK